MRLHRLEVTAFGPYADTQVVDFDSLNQAGVFLMTGPTGAGKTSILDAVCYALYSIVPGDREVRGLRSDHAPPDRAPRVELELTLCGRRLRVVRSPEWQRPKRRGTGTTKEQASARLFEIEPDGTERLVSDRAQEVGHELSMLLGMTSEQFMQVVLLPQSGFQTFLKAKSDERRVVLEKLFATERFSRIEDWMHERARVVRDRAQESLSDVRTLLAVLRDRSGGALPEDLGEPLSPGDASRLSTWATDLVAAAETRVVGLAAESRRTAEHADRAEEHAEDARRRHLLVQRRDRARAELAALTDAEAEHVERVAALDADRRAQGVAALVPALDRARARAATADEHASRAAGALLSALARHPWLAAPSESHNLAVDTAALLEHLTDEERRLRVLRARADDLLRHTDEVTTSERALAGAEAVVEELDADRVALPEQRTTLERELAAFTAQAARLADAVTQHDDAAERLAAARAQAALLPRLAAAEAREREAHTVANDARGHALDLVARRLAGIAAELAGDLVEGEACQVCGSTDHPAPAEPREGAVTESEQAAAQEVADTARLAHEEARRVADQLRAEVTESHLRAGGLDVPAAQAALREADVAVRDARTAEVARRACAERLEELTARLERLSTAHQEATAAAADLRARSSAARSARDAATADLREALDPTRHASPAGAPNHADHADRPDHADHAGRPYHADHAGQPDHPDHPDRPDHPDPPGQVAADLASRIESRLADVVALISLARRLDEARGAAAAAGQTLTEAAAEAGAAAQDAGFGDLDAARAALLDASVRRAWERQCREHDEARTRAVGVLAEPDVADLPEDDHDQVPGSLLGASGDLAVAEDAARAARQAHARAEAQHEHAQQQLTALRAQSDQLCSAVAAWAPAETEAATVGELANLVRGSGGNRLRMRLSSYVLATRLDQVLDAANARLSHMRDTRYLLRRTDRARRANAQAGLDLEVLDEWTGEVRPPTSLSGGECFVVSLALALGLADVIGEESGGVEVDTLFIDEGFGTLDPETLDQVMDRIDDLRSGGRSVGVVSHVSELRSRITTQVHVRPSRSGSQIAIAHTDA